MCFEDRIKSWLVNIKPRSKTSMFSREIKSPDIPKKSFTLIEKYKEGPLKE